MKPPRLAWRVAALLAATLPGGVAGAPAQTNSWAGSANCRPCHEDFYRLWLTSSHGRSLQPFTALLKTHLTSQPAPILSGQYKFLAEVQPAAVLERGPEGEQRHPIVQAVGGKDVFYFLTPLPRGRLQVLPLGYDLRRREWFDAPASARRHFGARLDRTLDWKERPLTFNTACASCHVSQVASSYDLESDRYETTWAEPGINCETCHGPAAEHARWFRNRPAPGPAPALKLVQPKKLSVEQRNALCAPCHAKRTALTQNFLPGDRFFDHFDLVGLESSDFYPDGRDLGENYTYTQWRRSPCANSGQLDCLHCHTSSGRYRFQEPVRANEACLPCHAERVKNASAHTHHRAGSPGNHCVSCHMPTTEFARMRRSDHSMRPPTPATTLAYHSPNACNLCHTNREAAWADQQVRQWHRADYQQPVLQAAALIAAARQGNWQQLPVMLQSLVAPGREEIQTVSLVRLLAGCADQTKWPVLRQLLRDSSPLVRSAAAEALGEQLDEPTILGLLKACADDYRVVRLRAAAALAALPEERLPEGSRGSARAALGELITSLKCRPDDAVSHYNLANLLMARAQPRAAVAEFENARRLEPDFLPVYVNAALAYAELEQKDKAETSLRGALRLEPTNAVVHLNLGMLLAEMGKPTDAEAAFRAAFQADPGSAQAAYNLGVLLAQDRPAESLTWCERAVRLEPHSLQYGYTYAFYLQQAGRLDQAMSVLKAVRAIHPEDESCSLLERQLLQRRSPSIPH